MERKSETYMRKVTWFGMEAIVKIGPGFIHRAGFGGILIPHPPLVNYLLRYGLPERHRQILSVTHELGHLETTHLALLYTLLMLSLNIIFGHIFWTNILFLLLGAHAAWEIMAEIYTMIRLSSDYFRFYTDHAVFSRAVFYIITVSLTIAGWYVVFW
jgi:hypothetical protein